MSEDGFDMVPVSSSQIAEVGFNSETKQIRIRFSKNQSLYEYDSCTEEEYQALVNAASVGQEFQGGIKQTKFYRRIG